MTQPNPVLIIKCKNDAQKDRIILSLGRLVQMGGVRVRTLMPSNGRFLVVWPGTYVLNVDVAKAKEKRRWMRKGAMFLDLEQWKSNDSAFHQM